MPQENFHPRNLRRPSPGVLVKPAFHQVAAQTLTVSGTGVPPLQLPAETLGPRNSFFAGKLSLPLIFGFFFSLVAAFSATSNIFAENAVSTELPRQIAQASPAPQTPDHPEDIPILLQKLLNPDAQVRAAASQSLGVIPSEAKIPALVKALTDPNWRIQVLAAFHLGKMATKARRAIPALADAQDSPNSDVRFVIAKALGQIGSEAVVPPLARALQDRDENVRMAAAIALDKMGPEAQEALPVLQKSLRDGNWFVRSHAAAAFVRLAARSDSMLPVLLRALQNPLAERPSHGVAYHLRRQDEIPAVVAIDALAARGPEVVPRLLASCQNLDFLDVYETELNKKIMLLLLALSAKSGDEQVINLLINFFKDIPFPMDEGNSRVRIFSNFGQKIIFGKVLHDSYSVQVNPAHVQKLRNKKYYLRAAALTAISQMDIHPIGSEMPYIINALKDPDWRVRWTALSVRHDHPSEELYSDKISAAFANALHDADWRVRVHAIRTCKHGNNSHILLDLLQDPNEQVRLAAAIRLAKSKIKSDDADRILSNALQNQQHAITRLAAFKALQFRSDVAEQAAIQALKDNNYKIRAFAAHNIGGSNIKTMPTLIEALQDENTDVRIGAAMALGNINSPMAISALIAALSDADERVREAAGSSIDESELVQSAIQEIEKQLHHGDWVMRRQAVEKLRLIKNNLPLPSLHQALKDQNPNVRASVAATLIPYYRDPDDNLKLDIDLVASFEGFLDSLKNGDPQARLDIILVLNRLGQAALPAIPELRNALADENWLIRYAAAIILIKLNPQETAVIPVLDEIFQDPKKAEQLIVDDQNLCEHDELHALGKIGSPEAIAALIKLFPVADEKMRYTNYLNENIEEISPAADILVRVGSKAVSALEVALKNENTRSIAAYTLGEIGCQDPLIAILQSKDRIEPALQEIFREKDADLRRSAVYALGRIGKKRSVKNRIPPDTNASSPLKKAINKRLVFVMNDKTELPEVRWMAAVSLMKMSKKVNFPFSGLNLPKPLDDDQLLFEDSHFDLYAVRCLFEVDLIKGGGYELKELVRNLLIKMSSPSSTPHKTQPTSTSR